MFPPPPLELELSLIYPSDCSTDWFTDRLTLPAAFISALVVGISLHYHKIVQNEWFGYPQEWFPSVSATIGDRYPERSFFQLFIALTSGQSARDSRSKNTQLLPENPTNSQD